MGETLNGVSPLREKITHFQKTHHGSTLGYYSWHGLSLECTIVTRGGAKPNYGIRKAPNYVFFTKLISNKHVSKYLYWETRKTLWDRSVCPDERGSNIQQSVKSGELTLAAPHSNRLGWVKEKKTVFLCLIDYCTQTELQRQFITLGNRSSIRILFHYNP